MIGSTCSYKNMESMITLHSVLFIGVMCVVQTVSQVCPYTHPRCSCYSDSVTCEDLEEIPPLNTGSNVIQVKFLTFNGGNITSISNNSLPPGLTLIDLNRPSLTNISEDAFDTSAATLEKIYFSYLHLNSLPLALKKLTKLTTLGIQYTTIKDWDTATLKQIATTLEDLTLYGVGLSTWPSWIVYFHVLQDIRLNGNSVYSIPDDAFISIKDSLRNLDVSNTGLTHVPQALSTLSSLTDLDLAYNNYTDISEIETITGFPFAQRLSTLSLDNVGMSRIVNFSKLTNLLSIRLSRNGLSDIPAGLLPTSLTSLFLYRNSFSYVPTVVATLSSLSDLDMYSNLITDIEPNSFPQSLTKLDLGENKINIITNTTFRNLNLLQTLSLNYNPITTISPEAFSDLVSLKTLEIKSSQLIEIPLAFARLNSAVQVSFSTIKQLACPCPVFHELVQWFTSHAGTFDINTSTCSNGQSVNSYLRGSC